MRSHNPSPLNGWRSLRVALSLCAIFLLQGFDSGPRELSPRQPTALVRVDLASEAELGELAASGLLVYAQLYSPGGGVYLLAPADSSQQAELARQGYASRVLDLDTRGANYSLLYGLPDALHRAESYGDILIVEGRQAVARATAGQLERLAGLGIKSLPLHPYPLVSPKVEKDLSAPQSISPYAAVQEMVAQVDSNALHTTVGYLSGEWPVTISGAPYTIATRYTYTDTPIKKATRYAYDYFLSLGLPTWYDYYSLSGYEKRSVLAEKTGLTQPNRIFLLSAHLDSFSGLPYSLAPGADDNASGSAGLMHIADILNQYDFGCTLRYALFTGEEQGLYGSRAYAGDIFAGGENLEAELNLDMVAYNTPNSQPTIELHTRPGNGGDLSIANLFAEVVSTYNINLIPLILPDGLSFSDHKAFWEYGYPAILAIEDWSDHTPYYHSTNDQLETLNMPYFSEFVKASLATFAHMGCLLESQVRGTVRDQSTGALLSGARIEAWLNAEMVAWTSTLGDGSYQMDLPPGAYTMVASALDHLADTIENVQVLQGQTTLLDISLKECISVKGAAFTFSPPQPALGETVTFIGAAQAGDLPISYTWDFGDGNGDSGQTATHTYNSRGGFVAKLAVNNVCAIPATYAQPVFVEVNLNYFPIGMRETQP